MSEQPTTSQRTEGYGDLIVYRSDDFKVTITKAEPRIRIDAQMLSGLRLDRDHWATYDAQTEALTLRPHKGRTVVYRVLWDTLDEDTNLVDCEWPD